MSAERDVPAHYSHGGLRERLRAALADDGVDPEHPSLAALAAYDQFHGRGLEATIEMADALAPLGLSVALHKYYGADAVVEFFTSRAECAHFYSMGITRTDRDKFERVLGRAGSAIRNVCIDVANGYSENFVRFVESFRRDHPGLTLMAGNVVTGEMTEELILSGASAMELRRKAIDPLRFPDLSLTIVKLMGSGEYAVEVPGAEPTGHFGLAVRDYTHSTAPNRRSPDVVTQRMLKSALAGAQPAYSLDELRELALHCTFQEDNATKVERQIRKSAAALLLENRIGQRFQGIVTGASEKGTWVRVLAPPVEGKLQRGWEGLDVGDRIEVRLLGTDVERGFIDFARV